MLTPNQLNRIDQHLRKDNWLLNEELIAELTDHYAAGIDERMAQGRSFADALLDIHTGFGGRKGLLSMEKDAQKQQSKKYYRQEWQLIRSFTQGTRWYVSVGLLVSMFLLNTIWGQYDTFKSAYTAGLGFVGSAVIGHILVKMILAFRYRREITTIQSTSSPVFIRLYVLTATLLLIDRYVLPAYRLTLPPDLVVLVVTVIETLCLVYFLACLTLIRQLIRDELNRRKLKTNHFTPVADSVSSTQRQRQAR